MGVGKTSESAGYFAIEPSQSRKSDDYGPRHPQNWSLAGFLCPERLTIRGKKSTISVDFRPRHQRRPAFKNPTSKMATSPTWSLITYHDPLTKLVRRDSCRFP